MKSSFGELTCEIFVTPDNRYKATFRIGKLRPYYAEIVCLSRIFKTGRIVKRVDIEKVKTWLDFVHACDEIADEHGFTIGKKEWSFSARF